MALHLMCLTASGGMPIFTRKRGNCENLPFSTVASLNSVEMFCASQDIKLKSTKSDEWSIVWRTFEVITIIIAAKGLSEKNLNRLLDLVSNSFLVCISLEDFQSPQNFDRIKREAKNYIRIIDKILDSYETDILNLNHCILSSENQQLLSRLNEFSSQLGSLYCSIIINQKLAVATEAWWNLDIIDKKLLITILNSFDTTQTDIAIYLPKKSPNTAYRFVTIRITTQVVLGVICGAEPSYQDINLLAQQIFKNDYDLLHTVEQSSPENIPSFIEIDSHVLGMILINKKLQKYVAVKNIQQCSSINRMKIDLLMKYLQKFYVQAVDSIDDYLNVKNNNPTEKIGKTKALQQYWCSDDFKCFSYQDDDGNLICAGYDSTIQNYTMQLITKKSLSSILQHMAICWQ